MADPLITPEDIAEAAKGAAEFTSDGTTAKAVPVKDMIAAAAYLNAATIEDAGGPKSAWARVRMARAIPPGAGPSG